jgi:hypothetical protein
MLHMYSSMLIKDSVYEVLKISCTECGMEKNYATPKVQKKHLWVDYNCFGWIIVALGGI